MTEGFAEEGSSIEVGISPDAAAEFLRKLATDEEFRARFESDTVNLLAEYGITGAEGHLPDEVVAPPRGLLLEAVAALGIGGDDFPYTPVAAGGGGGGPGAPHTPVSANAPHTFGPVPFAPFSFGYWVVFHVLDAASKREQ